MRLRHLHLPSVHPHYVPYSVACRVQEHIRRQHLDFKDAPPGSSSAPPQPTLISFTPQPIYTLGRRQTAPLAAAEAARLAAPLHVPGPPGGGRDSQDATFGVQVRHAPRGGLTTYHGPGQAVLWPVLDLKAAHQRHRHLTVRCYARLLEATTIATLRAQFGLRAFTTDDPGVWVRLIGDDDDAKIAALGVHLRRHVTALGTAINVAMPTICPSPPSLSSSSSSSFSSTTTAAIQEATNPWSRITPCGLQSKGVTSVAGALGLASSSPSTSPSTPTPPTSMTAAAVAAAWAEELARRLGLEEPVEAVALEEVAGLVERLVVGGDGRGKEEAVEDREREREYVEWLKGSAVARRG